MKCGSCTKCCLFPGIMMPSDVKKLAQFLNISVQKTFEKYLIFVVIAKKSDENRKNNNSEEANIVFGLAPRKKGTKDKIINYNYNTSHSLFGLKKCIFLKNNAGCTIHTVKPYACKEYQCEKIGSKNYSYEKLYNTWKKEQQIIFKLMPELRKVKTNEELERYFNIKKISTYSDKD